MRLLWMALLAAGMAPGANWQVVSAGPFRVYSDDGGRAAQMVAGDLEQFRHALGTVLGVEDLQTTWPIQVVTYSSTAEAAERKLATPLVLARDSYLTVLSRQQGLTPEWLQAATYLFLETGLAGAPKTVEDGLAAVMAMLRIDGVRISLGQPPPPAGRTFAWALVHMLTVSPEYSGKFRILMRNLPRTPDNEPAYRNALGKGEREIVKEAEEYLKRGTFPTIPISGKAISATRDLYADPVRPEAAQLLQADVRLAKGELDVAKAAYLGVANEPRLGPAAQEGLGLVALRQSRKEDALTHFREAIKAPQGGAIAFLELARMENDSQEAGRLLREAAARNPRWPEPYRELAKRSEDPIEKARALGEAVKRAPRALEDWQAMGRAYSEAKLYMEARQAWYGAERVAPNAETAAYCREQRVAVDRARMDAEQEAELAKRKAEADALERLRQEALARIRAKEAEVNQDAPARSPNVEVVQLPDLTTAKRMPALLRKVECRGKQFLLVVQAEDSGNTARFLFDPSRTLVIGPEEMTFRCNQLLRDVPATVVYQSKADPKLGTLGEVGAIEIR